MDNLYENDYKQNEEFINAFPSTNIMSGVETSYETSAIMSPYKGNVFEQEDEYFNFYKPIADYDLLQEPKTAFVTKALYSNPISEEQKEKLAKKINGNSRKYTY